jgi:hypothetical protein
VGRAARRLRIYPKTDKRGGVQGNAAARQKSNLEPRELGEQGQPDGTATRKTIPDAFGRFVKNCMNGKYSDTDADALAVIGFHNESR